jgi:hypothetical protein
MCTKLCERAHMRNGVPMEHVPGRLLNGSSGLAGQLHLSSCPIICCSATLPFTASSATITMISSMLWGFLWCYRGLPIELHTTHSLLSMHGPRYVMLPWFSQIHTP